MVVVFDLDDTLYKEADYVASGYAYVVRRLSRRLRVPRQDLDNVVKMAVDSCTAHPFDALFEHIDRKVAVQRMVSWYRKHVPYLILPEESRMCLEMLLNREYQLAMITDGRSEGQWNKIHALGIDRYIRRDLISVSEEIGADKKDLRPWTRMMELLPGEIDWWYVGDNPRKDFFHPNTLGWKTVMLLDDGRNIKSQHIQLPPEYYAQFTIESLTQLPGLIEECE